MRHVNVKSYRALVPDNTFIGEYMRMCDGIETAEVYDFWCALWILGTALGRDVVVPRPRAPVYMNWYVMLVANSGLTRKSTAVGIARNMVASIVPAMVEGRASASHLVSRLAQFPHMAICVAELVTLLGKEHFMLEIPGLLTDLYDCPEERVGGGTVFMGAQHLVKPYVTFLSASTPTWLQSAVNPAVIEGGFTSRCMFIHAEEPKKRVAWPSEATVDESRVRALLDECVQYGRGAGAIELYAGGRRKYEAWYKARKTASVDPFLSSFHSREDSHLLRIAACLAINDRSYGIAREHILAAQRVLRHVRLGSTELFSGSGKVSRIAVGIGRISELIMESGPTGESHTAIYLRVRSYMDSDTFRATMQLMIETQMVVGVIDNRGGAHGRKGVRYMRGPRLHHPTAAAEVREAVLGAPT